MSGRSFFLGCVGAAVIGFFAVGGAIVSTSHGAAARASDLSAVPNLSCSSATACATDANALSGPGLNSTSKGGNGLTASTAFKSTSTKFAAGVVGTDASTSGIFDFGVEGRSANGTGVFGTSTSFVGVRGLSNSGVGGIGVLGESLGGGVGLEGLSPLGTGSIGVQGSGNAIGVQGKGNQSTSISVLADGVGGLLFVGNGTFGKVFSVSNAGNVIANSFISAGIEVDAPIGNFFTSSPGAAVFGSAADEGVLGFATDSASTFGAVEAEGSGGPLFQGLNSSQLDVFDVDDSGNLTISGVIKTSGSCSSGCIRTGPSQTRVVSYAPRESQPTMEDVGEAQLVGGEARVALDPAFANVIDAGTSYLVFVTPLGDCKGLFVSSRSHAGFVVRELEGGRSAVPFEYRIVARPLGDRSARLPFVTVRAITNQLDAVRSRHKTR